MSLLDKLPKLPFFGKNEPPRENFFALHIRFNEVTGAVWSMDGGRVFVINTSTVPYTDGGEFKTEESQSELINVSNQALDEALANIAPEPEKLLFGVPDAWLEDENIKPEYLKILKKMVKELDVTPMAYVSTTHAIAHLMQKQTGTPLSGILVEVGDIVTVTVLKSGKTVGWTSLSVTKKISDSVEKALSTMKDIEVLPSRMIVYGEHNLEKAQDELASHPWMQSLPFLHLPKVETLSPLIATEAIAFAGASELNPEVNPNIVNQALVGVSAKKLSRELPPDDDFEEVEEPHPAKAVRDEEFDEQEELIDDESEEFMEQEDWVGEDQRPQARKRLGDDEYSTYERSEHRDESALAKIQETVMAPFAALSRPNIGGGSGRPMTKILIGVFVTIIVIGLLVYFVPSAKVNVFVDLKPLENSAEVLADPSAASVDPDKNIIPGKVVDTSINGSGEAAATGTKQIGDPAKGAVVVYNKTNSPVTLSQGTELTGPSNLRFKLDSSVNIASQSAVEGGISFGKSTVNVTATAVGPDGNIAAGTDLTVAGKSDNDVSAKSDAAFSGGVSKTVTVVSSEDQAKLLARVSGELRTKATEQLQGKLEGDQKILEEALLETISKKTFNKNVGDQANNLSLTINANYKGTAYSDADLKSIVAKLVTTKTPDAAKYELDLTQTQTQASVAKAEKDGKLYFTAKFVAKLKPKIDVNMLAGKIVGKTPAEAKQILKDSEPSIIGSEFQLSPPLPSAISRLPLRKEAIKLNIEAK